MTSAEFQALLARLRDAWNAGDATGAAACFAEDVDYADPVRYRFTSRAALLPFFEPPPGGHTTRWHRVLFDEAAQTGVVEYTYRGHHRYHGCAIVEVDREGRISRWREWQHLDDARDWDAYLAGMAGDTDHSPAGEASPRLTADTLAVEAGVPRGHVDNALSIGAVEPADDGRFDLSDAAIVATVGALLDAGVGTDDLRWLMTERGFRLDVLGRLYEATDARSGRSFAAVSAALGPAGGQLARVTGSLGLPVPEPDDHLGSSEEALLLDFLGEWLAVDPSGDAAASVARAIRDGLTRTTQTWLDAWDAKATPTLATQGAPPDTPGENPTVRMSRVARRLLPLLLDRMLRAAIDARIIAAVEHELIDAGRIPPRPAKPSAVAFVDLSGFTSHTLAAGDEAAAVAADRLGALAEEAVAPSGGRVVKHLGDGVLLLFPDAPAAVEATLGLVNATARAGLLPVHAAIAAGRVVQRDGDVYGATVNLAARMLDLAGAGEVVVEEGAVVALPRGTASLEPLGRVALRGLPDPVAVWRASSPGSGPVTVG